VTAPEPPPRDAALQGAWVERTATALARCPNADLLVDRMVRGALAQWRLDEATLWRRVGLRLRRPLPQARRAAIPGA
jgi:hypothetical protein